MESNSNNNSHYQLTRKPTKIVGTGSIAPSRQRSASLPSRSRDQALLTQQIQAGRQRSSSQPPASNYIQTTFGDFAQILDIIKKNAHLFSKAEIDHMRSTLKALSILDTNAEEIAAAKQPRAYAMKLTNIGIEDGFNKGESAQHIRANARLIIDNLPTNTSDQINYIRATLQRADPCLTARMEMIQDHISFKQLGEIQVDGVVDKKLAGTLFSDWNEYMVEHEENETVSESQLWAQFVAQIPASVKAHPNFWQSLAWAKDAAMIS